LPQPPFPATKRKGRSRNFFGNLHEAYLRIIVRVAVGYNDVNSPFAQFINTKAQKPLANFLSLKTRFNRDGRQNENLSIILIKNKSGKHNTARNNTRFPRGKHKESFIVGQDEQVSH